MRGINWTLRNWDSDIVVKAGTDAIVLIGPCGIKTCDFVFLIDCYSDTNEKDFNWLECFIHEGDFNYILILEM